MKAQTLVTRRYLCKCGRDMSASVTACKFPRSIACACGESAATFSKQELKIMEGLGNGFSIKAIARTLRRDYRTVWTHIAAMAERLGVRGTPGLTAWAIERRVRRATQQEQHTAPAAGTDVV